jgi:predicted N-acetyltransferase YhbS
MTEGIMKIISITTLDSEWQMTIDYAGQCPWKAGPFLAQAMRENQFKDWERVFVAIEGETIIGFCTLAKTDCVPDVPYSPYIGYIFVDEKHRGRRISEHMIREALMYAKTLGFEKAYLVSDHVDLYEKYGFAHIDTKEDLWGRMEKIYVHMT